MGQKIHPEGFRVGYIHDWKSNWFDERNFADLLLEDIAIRDHIENKLSHAGLSDINIVKQRGEITVDIHTARPGHRDRQVRRRGRRPAPRPAPDHQEAGQGQHPRDQAPRARRQARRPVDRRAAPEPGRLPPRDEARADLGDALRRQGRQGPGLRPPRRRRDGAHRGLLRRPRAAAHAARRHRLRLRRGEDDHRPDRRQVLDQQGRGDARGLPLGDGDEEELAPRSFRRKPRAAAATAARAAARAAAPGGGQGGRRQAAPAPGAPRSARRRSRPPPRRAPTPPRRPSPPQAAEPSSGRGAGGRPAADAPPPTARRGRCGPDADAEAGQAPQADARQAPRQHQGRRHGRLRRVRPQGDSSAAGSPTARSRPPESR